MPNNTTYILCSPKWIFVYISRTKHVDVDSKPTLFLTLSGFPSAETTTKFTEPKYTGTSAKELTIRTNDMLGNILTCSFWQYTTIRGRIWGLLCLPPTSGCLKGENNEEKWGIRKRRFCHKLSGLTWNWLPASNCLPSLMSFFTNFLQIRPYKRYLFGYWLCNGGCASGFSSWTSIVSSLYKRYM